MATEVLLRRTIDGVGTVGEVVKVKNGYARNFLLPQGYAALVNQESMRRIDRDKKEQAVRELALSKERAALAEQLADVTLTLEARAGEDGHLYGSVGVRQIIEALTALDYRFLERQVRFETVRELGKYEVILMLGGDKELTLPVWVVQDAADQQEMADLAARLAAEEAQGEADATAAAEGEPEGEPEASEEAQAEGEADPKV